MAVRGEGDPLELYKWLINDICTNQNQSWRINIWNSLEYWDANGSPNSDKMIKFNYCKQEENLFIKFIGHKKKKKKKLQESEKFDKYQDLIREL